MPDHVVSQGECLSSIADHYGLLKQTIWDHSGNAELRRRRPNPDTLFPGDVLFVPPQNETEFDRPVDQMHKFVVKSDQIRFRLRFLLDDKPRANEPYVLEIGRLKLAGKTDQNGWLDQRIPANEPEGVLRLGSGQEQY